MSRSRRRKPVSTKGATAVQVGTANFVTPSAAVDVADGIERWLAERGIATVRELVGTLRREPGPAEGR